MTRINVLPLNELRREEIHAEYNELPRVFGLVQKLLIRNPGAHPIDRSAVRIPANYTMGTGHVSFFYDKLMFLSNRQELLVAHLLNLGYNLTYTTPFAVDPRFRNIPPVWWGEYWPTEEAMELNRERLRLRRSERGVEI